MKHDGLLYGVPKSLRDCAIFGGQFATDLTPRTKVPQIIHRSTAGPDPENDGEIRCTLFDALRFYWRPAMLMTSGDMAWSDPGGGGVYSFAQLHGTEIGTDYYYQRIAARNVNGWLQAQQNLIYNVPVSAEREAYEVAPAKDESGRNYSFQLRASIGSNINFYPSLAGGQRDIRLVLDTDLAFSVQLAVTVGGLFFPFGPPAALSSRALYYTPGYGPPNYDYVQVGTALFDFTNQDLHHDSPGMVVSIPLWKGTGILNSGSFPNYDLSGVGVRVEYISFPLRDSADRGQL